MMDENNVFRGPDLPEPFPEVSLGERCYQQLQTFDSDYVIMIEADSGEECTAHQLLQKSVNAAVGLKEFGIEKNDAVCLIAKNGIEVCAASLGTLFIGGVVAPLDPTMKPFEFQHMFQLIEPKIMICDPEILATVNQALEQIGWKTPVFTFGDNGSAEAFQSLVVETNIDDIIPEHYESPDDVCLIVASSGTTGLQKGVCLTHTNIHFEIFLGRKTVSIFPTDAFFLHTSHFFWISGIFIFFTSVCVGVKRILIGDMNEAFILESIEKYKPLWCIMAPSLAKALMEHPDFKTRDVSSINYVITCGSLLPPATVDLIKETWNADMKIGSAYGLSELSGCYLSIDPKKDTQSVGSPNPGTAIKAIDVETGDNVPPGEEGEICCQSYGLMKCYLKNPEATADCIDDDKWLHTGDLGYITPDGLVYITGRIKELMKLDNHQIAPAEIEQLILTLSGVLDVAVAGIKISEDSSHPMAIVVKAPDSDVSEEEIIKIVNENLSDFKQLKAGVCFVDKIPRTMTGKIKRRVLQELADQLYMGDTPSIF